MNKIFIFFQCLVLALVVESSLLAKNKPNILFIFADDQCYKTIGALNNNEIKTPNLDRLVKNGTTFTHSYNMGGYHGAVCVASRTMLITGKHIWHAKNSEKELKKSLDGKLWPQLMAKAGYETFLLESGMLRQMPIICLELQEIFGEVCLGKLPKDITDH